MFDQLDALERTAEDEEQAARQQEWGGLEQLRLVRRDNYRLIQTVIGMELIDPRWEHLVKRYQQAFPAFKVAASVHTRISPKNLSSVLRKQVDSHQRAPEFSRRLTRHGPDDPQMPP